jgi:hypothetical protein
VELSGQLSLSLSLSLSPTLAKEGFSLGNLGKNSESSTTVKAGDLRNVGPVRRLY